VFQSVFHPSFTSQECFMQEYDTIQLETGGGLARLTLNRPDRRNGMNNLMVQETHAALLRVAADRELRVLLLTGAGDSFCPGADLKGMTSTAERGSDVALTPECFQVPALLHSMPQVSIAAVNGACAGAGFGWACGADIRVARAGAMFNTAFLNVAVAGDMGVPWSLPRLVGAAKAREWSFFCEKFSVEEARLAGLVARVWPAEHFHREVEALVAGLLAKSPTALKTMKAHYLAAESMGYADFLMLETERHMRIASSKHTQEAFRAFMEKRQPVFD
jgi:2-(1,2-epoxy-1,2-dihydrophenyl)acetyl-CoA isomerase